DIIQYVQTDAGPQWINAPQFWNGSTGAPDPNRGEGTVLGVIDTGVNWDSVFFDPSQSNLTVTNPRDGFFGLCNDDVLDIPCNDKLIGVYDFTDEDTNGFDPDGHGSHTASTAVGLPLTLESDHDGASGPATNIQFSTSGVAPRASFISYKACEADPDEPAGNFVCPLSATSAALEQAIADEVDVVNYSIGGPADDPWSLGGNQRLFLNLREAGVVAAVSAGNSGPNDSTVGSPANTPWVMAVANALHGRILANRLIDVSGGPFPLGDLVGQGISGGTGVVPIVHARDFGNALCGTGPAELGPQCDDNTGASNPFPAGTFDGQIVVCDRGEYGRVEKGRNVQLGGAAGMILANTDFEGESTVADEHCLPATHVGDSDGDRLREWLESGGGHQGRLTGTGRFVDPQIAGRLNDSSARGPAVGAPDLMKPNVTAPGTSILAAGTQTDEAGTGPGPDADVQAMFLTGTSMSAPHVAGAALLLRSANPDWGVAEVVSALETTAAADIVRNSDDSEARVPDRGAGGVQVDLAAQIGLYLPVSQANFLAANPTSGGDPGALNLAGVVSDNCVGSCQFTRTVRALGAGTWNVSGEGDLDIEVTPSLFTLAEGQQREIQITVSRGRVDLSEWGAGSVVLSPSSGDFTTQRLAVGASWLP
ncbi:MAG: S8 family serine peptidase, partial [Wenzhouxiangellaceae bacterium]